MIIAGIDQSLTGTAVTTPEGENMEKICKNCGKIFNSYYSDSKFCSKSCSSSFNNKAKSHDDVHIKCAFCNNEFIVKYKKRYRKFCSRVCSNNFQKDETLSIESRINKSNGHKGQIPFNKGKKFEELFGEKRSQEIKERILKNSLNTKKINKKEKEIVKTCLFCNTKFIVFYKYRYKKYCSSSCFHESRKGIKRKPFSLETKIKMSIARKGKIRIQSEEEKRKRRVNVFERLKKIKDENFQMVPNWNPVACDFFEKFDIENDTIGRHARNGGEFYIKELGYWLDYINKDLKIIIEYDEERHFDENGNLKEKDILRQHEIQKIYPDYQFLRIRQW